MITIQKSPTADTRTCDVTKVTREVLVDSSRKHIQDVQFGLAFFRQKLAEAGAAHDYTKLERMLERLQKVTAAEVQSVARKYFIDDTLTVGVLEPQPLDNAPRRPAVATRH